MYVLLFYAYRLPLNKSSNTTDPVAFFCDPNPTVLDAERGFKPEQSDFITPAKAGWDLEGQNQMDVDPDTGAYGR